MANITRLAKKFNLTRQGIYKIDKANNFNFSVIDDVKAEELLTEHLSKRSKNKSNIAKRLNISITKLNNILSRSSINLNEYVTAEETIKAINKFIKKETALKKAEEEKNQKRKTYINNLKVMFKTLKQLDNMALYLLQQLIRCDKKLYKRKGNVELLKIHISKLEQDQVFINEEREKVKQLIEETTGKDFNRSYAEYIRLLNN